MTPWTAVHQVSLSFTVSQSLLKLMSIESVMPSNHLILLLPPSPPAFNFSSIGGFSNESVLGIRWSKYWSFSINPFSEYSVLTSFRIDCFDLLAVQQDKTLKSLLQHHNLKASIKRHLFLGRKAMKKLDSILKKNRDITLQTKSLFKSNLWFLQ